VQKVQLVHVQLAPSQGVSWHLVEHLLIGQKGSQSPVTVPFFWTQVVVGVHLKGPSQVVVIVWVHLSPQLISCDSAKHCSLVQGGGQSKMSQYWPVQFLIWQVSSLQGDEAPLGVPHSVVHSILLQSLPGQGVSEHFSVQGDWQVELAQLT
jgi:hypothetical protein